MNYIVIDKNSLCQFGGDFTRHEYAQRFADILNISERSVVYIVVKQ